MFSIDKIKIFKPLLISTIVFSVAIFIVKILSSSWVFVNEIYPSFYKKLYPLYTNIFGSIPFSVGDILYILLGLIIVLMIISSIKCFFLGQKWRVFLIVSKIIYLLTFIYLSFNILWGFNYYRTGFYTKNEQENIQLSELKSILEYSIKQAKKERSNLTEDENGVFTYNTKDFKDSTPEELKSINNIDLTFKKIPIYSKKKNSLFSFFMRYFGVSGYYNPFTAEAQVTSKIPSISKPFTMLHEQAHQMGYAPEYEANFIAYITSIQSNSSAMKYSAHTKAANYLLSAIYPQDSIYVKTILDSYSEEMKRDRRDYLVFQKRYSGKVEEIFSSLNDIYLKSNKQDGVISYSYFVNVLVKYYRNNHELH